MTITVNWTLKDFKEMARLQAGKSVVTNFAAWFMAILFPVIGLVNVTGGKFVGPGWIFAGLGFHFLYQLTLGNFISIRKAYKDYKPKVQTLYADSDGVSGDNTTDTLITKWNIKWSHFSNLTENKSAFSLIAESPSLIYIPKRAFANEEDLNQFRAWASQIGHEPAPNSPLPEIK